jgi:nicotinamide mononucleotide transporter
MIEIAANAITTASIVLAARNSVHTWWLGVIGSILFGVTFYRAQLYADVALQVFFIATSLMGWWHWLRGRNGTAPKVSRAALPQLLIGVTTAAVATLGYGILLDRFTDAYAPFVDSAVLAFSVVAQILLMQRRVETWPVWLIVNSIAVPLFASRGLHLTAALYVAYWCNAWIGWYRWRHLAMRAGSA